jgi:macrolide-specific efflux system membrane fusion protein
MTRRTRMLLVTLFVWVGLAILATGCSSGPAPEELTPTPIPTRAVPIKPTYKVQRGDVIMQVQFTGRIAPVVEQELFFRTNGRVRNIYVGRSDTVTATQVLADLDVLDGLERQFTSDQLALRRAQVHVEIAQIQLDMVKQGAAAQDPEYDYQVAIKEHEVELAQIALEEVTLDNQDLESSIADAQIFAPFDGKILSLGLSEGQLVEAFKPVAVIADLNELEVSADLDSRLLENMAEDMPVVVEPFSRPGETINGTVRRLPYPYGGGSSDDTATDQTTRITLQVSPAEAGYEFGDLTRVTVVLAQAANVLWVPPQVIRTFEGREFVVVQDGEFQRRVDVQVGIKGNDRVEITDGLTEGQIVVGP